ncbi:MAG: DUF1573 domain-containing protein [Putridiphycobacter sp.]
MMKWIYIGVVFWCSTAFGQIRIDNPVFDFGDIFEDKGKVKTTFQLINPYVEDTIHILTIETSCGCTAVLAKDTVIYPESKINLEVEYDPNGRAGLFDKSIKIETLTGASEHNTLYLKIKGNVLGKQQDGGTTPELIDYKVSPIYFYPISPYDTSFLDFNFITDFINDLTYEIDYYKFTRVGFKVSVRDESVINDLDYMLKFVRYKFIRQLNVASYSINNIFFKLPVFEIADDFPSWAMAEIKAYSVSFNNDKVSESEIKTTNYKNQSIQNDTIDYVLNFKANQPLNVDTIFNKIDFNRLNQHLLENEEIKLNINYKVPESFSIKQVDKFKKEINKRIYKSFKADFGVSKKEIVYHYNPKFSHPSTKYYFQIWLDEDIKSPNRVNYVVKKDQIIQPLLPTYKEIIIADHQLLDTSSIKFKQFWAAFTSFYSKNKGVKLILESATSNLNRNLETDQLYLARQKSTHNKKLLNQLFWQQFKDTLEIEVKNVLLGPEHDLRTFKKSDYLQNEYVNLVPVFTAKRELPLKVKYPMPYIVNYDYFFNGVDTNSIVFKKFAEYLMYDIQTYGFVEVKTESSASHIPTNKKRSTYYMANKHLVESKKRLYKYFKDRLIDPNRFLITDETILVQGIPYSRKTPVVRYKPYQYVTFVPHKYLE